MGKYTARSFYGLSIFVFVLYLMRVSSVQSESKVQNIIDVMKNDTDLCSNFNFLYESNVTKICSTVMYSEKQLQSIFKFKEIFLCLAFYDTVYKVCHANQPQKFNNTTTFYSYIRKFFPEQTLEDENMFCNNVESIQFSYEKLNQFLSSKYFHEACPSICFETGKKFVPLCAILAWSKSIDDYANKQNQQKQLPSTISIPAKVNTDKDIKKPNGKVSHTPNKADKNKLDTVKNVTTVTNSAAAILDNTKAADTSTNAKPIEKLTEGTTQNKNKETATKSDMSEKQNISQGNLMTPNKTKVEAEDKVQDIDNLEKPPTSKQKLDANEQSEDTKSIPANNNNDDNRNNANVNSVIDNVKTSTISDNTQDHDSSLNDDDSIHPEDLNAAINSPIVTADKGKSVIEPSEQDTATRYHSIRTDEESHFFTYFTVISLISIAAYIGYHNKQKILAIVLEGRRSRSSRGRRRPSTANYRKLDCTLEEAVTSQCNANVTHVIY
ncbi:unnamed protein product [Xylocopa violacea]|uniref:Trans-Golgi network integral membrane protein TGN38 n=1 Tax=Xylocopa violacea TaxID=135666 RepID=A0ABP1NGJ9_XYLVO